MKNLILILLSANIFGFANAQTISTEKVWDLVFPGGNAFTKDSLKLENPTAPGAEYSAETRTRLVKKFFYKKDGINKSVVFFYKYDYSTGEKSSCHACSPKVFVAILSYKTNKWVKDVFKAIETDFQGQFGEGPELSSKLFDGVKCILSKQTIAYNGNGEYQQSCYYNIETLSKIKCDEIKTD